MSWPPDDDLDRDPKRALAKRILALWALATSPATGIGEKENAVAQLKRLQREHNLSDVQLAYIAEREQHRSRTNQVSLFEAIVELAPLVGVKLTFEQAIFIGLWALHTHVYTQFLHSPRLILRSDDAGHGKTVGLKCIRELADSPYLIISPTPAIIYRRLKRERATFLINEGEYSRFFSDRDLRALFDAGYEQGNTVPRVNRKGEVEDFPAYFPLALAAVIGREQLDRQQLRRSVVLDIARHLEGRDTIWPDDPRFTTVRGLIQEWAGTFCAPKHVELPPALTLDDADNWEVFVSIADSLGYGATARAVALFFYRPHDDVVNRLLLDIFRIFERMGVDRIWRDELLEALHNLVDANWDEFWGLKGKQDPHKLTRSELYQMLGKKGIKVGAVWKGNGLDRVCGKGFTRQQFEPAWSALGVTPSQPNKIIQLPRHSKRHGDDTATDNDDGKEDQSA